MRKPSMKKTSKKRADSTANALEMAARATENRKYVLRLYITGTTPQSQRALANIRRICEEHLKDRYELQVIDIYQKPSLAKDEQIIAAPTLIKILPHPLRRLIGDLSNDERV